MRTVGGHRLVAVGGGDDPLGLVEVRAGDPPVVAGAVDALVGSAGRGGERRGVRQSAKELIGDERRASRPGRARRG